METKRIRRADGTPVTHGAAILDLIEAMFLPTALAVIKCPAHQNTDTLIAKGNNFADEQAAIGAVMTPLLTIRDCEPLTTMPSLIAAQNRVTEAEKRLWVKRYNIIGQW